MRVARQDRAAFDALYFQTSAKLFGVFIRILGNRAEAEDAMQETYIKLWNRASQFQPGQGAAMGWVMTIARNHALDRIRARPGRAQGMRAVDPCPDAQAEGEASDPIAALADTAPSAFAQVAAEEDARKLLDCFDTLEAARAQAVRGAYLDGLSYADLSDRLGIPLNTVRTWLRRGLQTLRECMDR